MIETLEESKGHHHLQCIPKCILSRSNEATAFWSLQSPGAPLDFRGLPLPEAATAVSTNPILTANLSMIHAQFVFSFFQSQPRFKRDFSVEIAKCAFVF
jgi:hypothetical protein